MSATTLAPTAPPSTHDHAKRWLVLAVIAVAQLMVVLDMTIVNIGLSQAQADLGFADSQRQWVVTAYALAFGSLLLLGGRLGDLFGRKGTFVGGLIGFALASALGGTAGSFTVLVTSRALQGVFGALLAPSALALLATTFTDLRERGRAFGIFGAVAGGGGGVGLLLGGLLTEHASWRWCFYVNLLFAAVAVTGALLLLHNPTVRQRPRIDLLGALLAGSGLFCMVFGLSRAETDGWSDTLTLGMLAAALILLASFVLAESKTASPLLPLRVVLDRNRGAAYLSVALLAIATFSVFLFLTFYLQQVKHFSPVETGLAFLPMILCALIGSMVVSSRLLPRHGARRLVTAGMIAGAAGMFYLAQLTPASGYAGRILPALIIIGIGFALILATAMNTATRGVGPGDAGVASGMVNTMQQIGGSVGTALLSTVAASATTSYLTGRHAPAARVSGVVHGYATAYLVGGCLFLAGSVIAACLFTPAASHGARNEHQNQKRRR